jgi:hypothetical protein
MKTTFQRILATLLSAALILSSNAHAGSYEESQSILTKTKFQPEEIARALLNMQMTTSDLGQVISGLDYVRYRIERGQLDLVTEDVRVERPPTLIVSTDYKDGALNFRTTNGSIVIEAFNTGVEADRTELFREIDLSIRLFTAMKASIKKGIQQLRIAGKSEFAFAELEVIRKKNQAMADQSLDILNGTPGTEDDLQFLTNVGLGGGAASLLIAAMLGVSIPNPAFIGVVALALTNAWAHSLNILAHSDLNESLWSAYSHHNEVASGIFSAQTELAAIKMGL